LARYVGTMLAAVLVASCAARAEPIFSFAATPGKLPKTVVPINYSIELRPDAESLTLPGVAMIDIEVREPTARLTLNAVDIASDLRRPRGPCAAGDRCVDQGAQMMAARERFGSVALPGHSG